MNLVSLVHLEDLEDHDNLSCHHSLYRLVGLLYLHRLDLLVGHVDRSYPRAPFHQLDQLDLMDLFYLLDPLFLLFLRGQVDLLLLLDLNLPSVHQCQHHQGNRNYLAGLANL